MAGSIAFLRQFESQIPSLEQQQQSLRQGPRDLEDEEEKAIEHDMPILLDDSDDEDLVMEHLQTKTAYELDE